MTMGLPRSLDQLTRSEHIDIVAGNTRVGMHDGFPSKQVFRVEHRPVPNGTFRCDPAIPPWRYANALAMHVPQDIPRTRHENINYYDEPEQPLGMNEFNVPDSELVDFNNDSARQLGRYKELFYKGAASLSALHEASEYVEAALNSGLDIELDMDKALLSAFVPLSRLDALAAMVKATSNLTGPQQDSFIEKVMAFLAEKTAHALDKFDAGEAMRRGIQNQKELYARVRAQEESGNTPRMQQQTEQTMWGVRGTRQR
uniref:Uncharacterized protein n=1 Tax=Pseudomonas phage HRDY3 TaxID=3236930 RepID=A0AB39CE32_9VIRU